MNVLNLAAEVQLRDLSLAELARKAGLSRSTVWAIAAGAPGRPSSRRKLWAALDQFPHVPYVLPPTPLDAQVLPSPEPSPIPARRDPKALLAELEAMRPKWQSD